MRVDESPPLDAIGLADAIRDGALSAREAMLDALTRAEANRDLGAIRFIDAERGLARADALDRLLRDDAERCRAMPFFGVPFLLKDLGSPTAGFPMSCGSRSLLEAPVPSANSYLADRFLAAGLVPFGVSTVPEFGLSLTTEPAAEPIAHNPLDRARTPGGSSGGAAAAVAAGIVALAQSGDAAGSTRVPAACCGLFGLKPTRGAVPTGPPPGDNYFAGFVGELVLGRSLRDIAAALDAVVGRARGPEPDPDLGGPVRPRLGEPLPPMRIGICASGLPGAPVDPERCAAVERTAATLEAAGHRLVPLSVERLAPVCAWASSAFETIASVNLARNLAHTARDQLEPLTRAVLKGGQAIAGIALAEAHAAALQVAHAMWQLFEQIDLLLTPMLATAPPLLGAMPTDGVDVDAHWHRMRAFAPFALLANVAGVPALSAPLGFDEHGLPLAVHIVGPMGSDAHVLQCAHLLMTR